MEIRREGRSPGKACRCKRRADNFIKDLGMCAAFPSKKNKCHTSTLFIFEVKQIQTNKQKQIQSKSIILLLNVKCTCILFFIEVTVMFPFFHKTLNFYMDELSFGQALQCGNVLLRCTY
jgi:hypothetical protein